MSLRDLLNSLDLNENLTSFENQNEVIARFCFGLSGRRYHLVDLIPMILFVVFLNGRFPQQPSKSLTKSHLMPILAQRSINASKMVRDYVVQD